jgi:hypothetical protein
MPIIYINIETTMQTSTAKNKYVALFQAFIRAIFISIIFLKNSTKTVFFYFKDKIAPSFKKGPPARTEPEFEEVYKKDINFYKTMTANDANTNIDPTLYDYTLRKTLFVEENNPTEKQWRSRLLFENTYRGNIIMYYDAFRMTFSYYSDEQIVPYKALHHAALKYVVRFRCRNFFIDMETFPDNPMIEVLQKEDDSLKTKSKMNHGPPTSNKPKPQDNKQNAVFARLKDYSNTPNDKTKQQQNKPKHLFSNKFVRIGKMCEFNILQKPPSKKIEAVNSLLFSDKPMSSVTDFFDDDDKDLNIGVSLSPEQEIPKVPSDSNPFSIDQPKMTSYQLFKMMKQKEASIS